MCCYNSFHAEKLIGTNKTLTADTWHSITVIAELGTPILKISGSPDVTLSQGMTINLVATELINNAVTIECATSGDRAIIIYNN